MSPPILTCTDDERRKRVRAEGAGGLDYVEVSPDQLTITLYFIGAAPSDLRRENVRIDGGRHVRDIEVIDISVGEPEDPEQDGWVDVRVDRPGDYSTYTIRLLALDASGEQTTEPLPGLDPRYAELDFSFKASCPSDVDCAVETACPPVILPEPEISYLAKDYASFRQLILDRLALIMPDWQERHVPDLGIALVEQGKQDEAFRVLKPGGRLAVSDVVVRGDVPEEIQKSLLLWVGCIAGALRDEEYISKLKAAGFEAVSIEPTRVYQIEDARAFLTGQGMDVNAIAPLVDGKFMSAFIRASKPAFGTVLKQSLGLNVLKCC